MAEELVAYVKELQRTNPEAKELWVRYTREKGGRNFDPSRHTAEFLQEFINMIESGSSATFLSELDAAAAAGTMGMDGGDLVARVKDLQRTNQDAKEQWMIFTDTQGGIRDPARHTKESLEEFLNGMTTGSTLGGEDSTYSTLDSTLDFGEFIKALQKRSSSFKAAWGIYCKDYGGGLNDPNGHDMGFQARFFEMVTQAFVKMSRTGGAGELGLGMAAEPPKKKARMAPSGGAVPGSRKEAVVQAIKDFQKSSPENKELWAEYCVAYLGGNYDPNRHDEATLTEFCTNHGVMAPGMGAGLAGGLAGGMGGGGVAAALAGLGGGAGHNPWGAGGMENAFAALLAQMGGGGAVATPMMGGGGGAVAGGANSSEKQGLVDRIKVFQKASRENADVWRVFSGATKDPNRHGADKLEEFCALNGC